jgi:hypothetical protein
VRHFLQSVNCEEDSTEMIPWSSFEVGDLAVIVNAEMFPIASHCKRLYSLPQAVCSVI